MLPSLTNTTGMSQPNCHNSDGLTSFRHNLSVTNMGLFNHDGSYLVPSQLTITSKCHNQKISRNQALMPPSYETICLNREVCSKPIPDTKSICDFLFGYDKFWGKKDKENKSVLCVVCVCVVCKVCGLGLCYWYYIGIFVLL